MLRCTLGCLNQRPNPAKYHDKPWCCLHESTPASQPNAHKDPLKNCSCTTTKLHYSRPKYQQLQNIKAKRIQQHLCTHRSLPANGYLTKQQRKTDTNTPTKNANNIRLMQDLLSTPQNYHI